MATKSSYGTNQEQAPKKASGGAGRAARVAGWALAGVALVFVVVAATTTKSTPGLRATEEFYAAIGVIPGQGTCTGCTDDGCNCACANGGNIVIGGGSSGSVDGNDVTWNGPGGSGRVTDGNVEWNSPGSSGSVNGELPPYVGKVTVNGQTYGGSDWGGNGKVVVPGNKWWGGITVDYRRRLYSKYETCTTGQGCDQSHCSGKAEVRCDAGSCLQTDVKAPKVSCGGGGCLMQNVVASGVDGINCGGSGCNMTNTSAPLGKIYCGGGSCDQSMAVAHGSVYCGGGSCSQVQAVSLTDNVYTGGSSSDQSYASAATSVYCGGGSCEQPHASAVKSVYCGGGSCDQSYSSAGTGPGEGVSCPAGSCDQTGATGTKSCAAGNCVGG